MPSESIQIIKGALTISLTSCCKFQVIESAAAEGASLVNQWFVGCSASHVVCEGNSIRKYLGHSSNIVTVSVTSST